VKGRFCAGVVGFFVCVGLVGCVRVVPPQVDTTPPILNWKVENLSSGDTTSFKGQGGVTVKTGDGLRVTFTVADPEGMKRISLGGGSSFSCRGDGLGQNTAALFATQKVTFSIGPDGKIPTSFFFMVYPSTEEDCNPGFSFAGGSINLSGSGENWLGTVQTGSLAIQVTQ
jgi:hypothetical protein